LEGWLSLRASALVTSSQAFVDGYFKTLSRVRLPIRIVENKVLLLDKEAPRGNIERPVGPPWIIGWFGIIRCRKSFEVLRNLVWRGQGRVRVIIRGKPALNEIPDFHDIIEKTSGLSFDGPYKNPDDLAAMYQNVHFTWAIDMFEEGLNSVWLLPNRLYEGGLYGSVPVALENVETGHFLKKLAAGVLAREPLNDFLLGFFKDLADADYKKLEATGAEIPQATWVYSREDCRAFVSYLASLRHANIAGGSA
jgi:succinoglycan biosynthesis protein ExoL